MTGFRIHELVNCPVCGKQYSVTYLPRHVSMKHKKNVQVSYQ